MLEIVHDLKVVLQNAILQQLIEVNTKELRNDDFSNGVILKSCPISMMIALSNDMLESAHRYMLFNIAVVESFLQ